MEGSNSLSVAFVEMRSIPAPRAAVGTNDWTAWSGAASTRTVWAGAALASAAHAPRASEASRPARVAVAGDVRA